MREGAQAATARLQQRMHAKHHAMMTMMMMMMMMTTMRGGLGPGGGAGSAQALRLAILLPSMYKVLQHDGPGLAASLQTPHPYLAASLSTRVLAHGCVRAHPATPWLASGYILVLV
ncbi:hypothetical protein, partial [Flavobacterium sp.]|uniref:hypothetical protein n=1 Tax=Flavobacterium sp. TaxID=239 RepID=UPI004034403F